MKSLFTSKSPQRKFNSKGSKKQSLAKRQPSISEDVIARILQLEALIGKTTWCVDLMKELIMLYSVEIR